jgi:hypothetical protein
MDDLSVPDDFSVENLPQNGVPNLFKLTTHDLIW